MQLPKERQLKQQLEEIQNLETQRKDAYVFASISLIASIPTAIMIDMLASPAFLGLAFIQINRAKYISKQLTHAHREYDYILQKKG